MRAFAIAVGIILAAGISGAAGRDWACEGGPEFVRFVRSYDFVDQIPAAERTAYRRDLVTRGIQEHPEDIFYHRQYRSFVERRDESAIPAMLAQYRKLLDDHPRDALYLYLYGEALAGHQTDDAIQFLERAIAADAANPWPHIALSETYSYGRLVNKLKAAGEASAFWNLCPASLDPSALGTVSRVLPETGRKVVAGLRPRLEAETDINLLPTYETLWELELRNTPPSRQEEIKKTIAKDVEKLRAMPPPNRASWFQLLKKGAKSIGDEAGMRAADDALLQRFPNTNTALGILRARFSEEHPYPKSEASREEKQAYDAATAAFAEEMLKKWPDDAILLMMRSSAVAALEDPTPAQLRAAIEALLEHIWAKHDLSGFPPFEYRAAEAYVAHGVNLERVPFLVEKGLAAIEHNLEEDRKRDDTPPEDLESDRRNIDSNRVEGLRILIDLYTKSKEPAKAAAALAEVRKFPPKEGFAAPFYRQAGRVAQLEGRNLDALLHFQTAFDRWTGPPAGKQEIAADIERVWKELGGTGDSRALLGSHRPGAEVADNDAAWKKPEAPIPAFELEDSSGRMWRLKTLAGKTVLLNVWATWCGPCVAEHPDFQKLYDKLKDRPGIQVLTLNIDENAAEIAPYMKQHGYTFPVIPAQPMVELMLPRVSIPRNWIVDSKGNLQWEQTGYGSQNTEWEKRLLDMLEKTAGAQ